MMNWINDSKENRVLVIVGATAVGKTEVSLLVAEALRGEIVSADSRQVYRYMDIGTAKPDLQERTRVLHHFIDICTPDQYYSAGEYAAAARLCIAQLLQRRVVPIVVGGSGFYVQALVDGLFAPKISDAGIKEKWRQRIRDEGMEKICAYLHQVDPVTAARLHPNDEQRIVRALEVYELSGIPISRFRDGRTVAAEFVPVIIGLSRERQQLYQRIDQRVDRMIQQGLVDEVKSLQQRGYTRELNALRTVGYRQVFQCLSGEIAFDEMVKKMKLDTRHYAKRQMTWFRRDSRILWLEADFSSVDHIVDKIVSRWKE